MASASRLPASGAIAQHTCMVTGGCNGHHSTIGQPAQRVLDHLPQADIIIIIIIITIITIIILTLPAQASQLDMLSSHLHGLI